ncbi:MAG: periplasmic heavy metal sensor [Smithella sp.]|jgi:Spy/CpxP family protein refolding chaperone
MKNISSFLVLSFLILFIASQLSYAEPNDPVHKMEPGFQEECPPSMIPPMMPCGMGQMNGMPELEHPHWIRFQKLKLDKKQKEALRDVENSFTKELIRKRADEQIAEIELRELLDKETVDLKAVETKLKQIAAIQIETQLMVIKSMENMKAKLTAEQREMMKKIRPMEHRMRPPLMGKGMHKDEKLPPPFSEEKENN